MTTPTPLVSVPFVAASPRVCALLAGELAAMLRRWRIEQGVSAPAEVVVFVDAVCQLARAARSGGGSSNVPVEAAAVTMMPVSEAASVLGIGERAVRARLARGSLAGRRDHAGRWLVLLEP